ncbi:S8 family serine peptidase [Microbacterium sp. C5A9]|uniref:S8 family peptidase n=1 Tax=Microbacterium sp. C5A9 TaxID=2736663 RepID=UPI001F518A53|nr:S8/S53 family peptidase [Microbacterium sp. C5A9]MCI1017018.1 S8 family serine peptidase [Microbacterium sp. C5A9]
MRRTHRRVITIAGAAALAIAVAVPSSAAATTTAESGLWWFERGNVQAAHDAGFDGTGVKVAVIDSQINPDVTGLRGADLTLRESSYCYDASGEPIPTVSTDYVAASHGTKVASMIVGTGEAPAGGAPIEGVAPGVELLYYNAGAVLDGVVGDDGGDEACLQADGTDLGDDRRFGLDRAISDAVTDGADIISISTGSLTDVSQGLAEAYANDVVVVAAMPNDDGIALWPAGLNGVVAVQAFGEDGMIQNGVNGKPNLSDDVAIAAPGIRLLTPGSADSWDAQSLGSGTSYATPIVAGFLAVVKQKYPEATSGQLIQSLIHNTGTKGEHEPQWDNAAGYGAASLTGMLAVDPTKYPDENPLFNADDPNDPPSLSMVNEAKAALGQTDPTAAPSSQPDATDSPSASSSMTPWLVGGGILLVLLIIGGIILAIVLTRSSRRQNTEQGGNHGR